MSRALEAMRGDEMPYFHPALGRLTALQMLTLAMTHTDYHTRRMAALHAHPKFPRTGATIRDDR